VLDSERARVLAESAGAELLASRPAARDWVRRNAREGDRVLVKGSHAAHLDEVVRELTQA
jgi:UDP-N-acetylmuramyl pentapeptide synthase